MKKISTSFNLYRDYTILILNFHLNIKKIEKSSFALHCEKSEARDENGIVIAQGTCCKDVPDGATLLQQVVIFPYLILEHLLELKVRLKLMKQLFYAFTTNVLPVKSWKVLLPSVKNPIKNPM